MCPPRPKYFSGCFLCSRVAHREDGQSLEMNVEIMLKEITDWPGVARQTVDGLCRKQTAERRWIH